MPNHAVAVWWLSAMAGLLVGCDSTSSGPAPEHKRGEAVLRASAAIRRVCEIAAKNDDYNLSEATNASLKRIVRDTPYTSEELGAIAMACKALALSGDEERCGFVLEAASEYCIGLLSERTDEDARDALHGLEVDLYRDGGDALIIHEAIERQEELIKSGVPGESRGQHTDSCTGLTGGPDMYHEVLVPREFRAGRACAHAPSNHERYVSAYEAGWWACIESHVRDPDYRSTETDKTGVGWPAAVAGTRQGFDDCEARIADNIKHYGKNRMRQHLLELRDAK